MAFRDKSQTTTFFALSAVESFCYLKKRLALYLVLRYSFPGSLFSLSDEVSDEVLELFSYLE